MTGEIAVRVEPRAAGGVVAHVTIANARKLNTLNSPLIASFVAQIETLGQREDLRALVLTGDGDKAFVGGADIGEMAAIDSPEGAKGFIEGVHRACDAVRRFPAPVIARVNGYTLGAGLELMAACDVRLAADTAHFGMPEVRVGIPSVVEAALLPGLIGWGRTRRLLLLGETIGAAEALAWGLVEKVVPLGSLDAAIEEWLACVDAAGPRAMRTQKSLIGAWEGLPLGEAIAAGIPAFASAWETDEPRRMMSAFVNRPRG